MGVEEVGTVVPQSIPEPLPQERPAEPSQEPEVIEDSGTMLDIYV